MLGWKSSARSKLWAMPFPTLCQRMWLVGDCPSEINAYAPETYAPGCVALVFGATQTGAPPLEWFDGLADRIGLNEATASTLCMRHVDAFAWTAYWDATGQATPPDQKVQEWPPQ